MADTVAPGGDTPDRRPGTAPSGEVPSHPRPYVRGMLTPTDVRASPATSAGVRASGVEAALARTLDARATELLAVSPELDVVVQALRARMTGGKRLRAGFCLWAAAAASPAATGEEAVPGAVDAAAALEMFHLGALVHDDVMDRSDSRRGVATVHRSFATDHARSSWPGDAELYGQSVAILAGDLCLTWADDLLAAAVAGAAGAADGAAARRVWELMRTQTMAGQFLDLQSATRARSVDEVTRVLINKSAKYTVEHPMLLGATLAGATRT